MLRAISRAGPVITSRRNISVAALNLNLRKVCRRTSFCILGITQQDDDTHHISFAPQMATSEPPAVTESPIMCYNWICECCGCCPSSRNNLTDQRNVIVGPPRRPIRAPPHPCFGSQAGDKRVVSVPALAHQPQPYAAWYYVAIFQKASETHSTSPHPHLCQVQATDRVKLIDIDLANKPAWLPRFSPLGKVPAVTYLEGEGGRGGEGGGAGATLTYNGV